MQTVGVIKRGKYYYCQKCKNEDQHLFGRYYDIVMCVESIYCRRCSERVQSNTTTIMMPENADVSWGDTFSIQLAFDLTAAQRKAVFKIQSLVYMYRKIMLHAVCGAGKTEIIVLVIANYLRRGAKIGWAIARRDVVIELKERLADYFSETKTVALYQDSPDLGEDGQLVVLTTARLHYFYQAFDMLILDENDAYPFNLSQFQQNVADTSVKHGGNILYISATITKQEKHEYPQIISLAERFHGKPLPAIIFEYYPMHRYRRTIGKKVQRRINEWVNTEKPVFLFVSNKSLGKEIEKKCRKIWGDIVSYVSSDIKNRQEILGKIRKRELKILVTTTILERGVTFKDVQVIVLDADALVFNAATLVQIAGRVGRAFDSTEGAIYFCYQNAITEEMKKAKKYHEKANEGKVLFL